MKRFLDYLVRAMPFSALAWYRGELVHWRMWRWCWTRRGDVRYAQGPGLRYRHFGDVVVLDLARWVKYRRVGFVSHACLGRLCFYRRIGELRSWRPSFQTLP